MVPQARALKAEKVAAWGPDAENALADTLGDDPEQVRAGVNGGELELWRLWDGEAWMVTRTCPAVLTVCCYAGRDARAAFAALAAHGRRQGIGAVEFFTRSKALGRMMRRDGFAERETVYRVKL